MSHALGIALILALAAVTAGLVPLLLQLRRTARSLDAFLHSAQLDLAQIAQDVHAARLRTDEMAASLLPTLESMGRMSHTLDDTRKGLADLVERYKHGFESASRTLGGLLGGLASLRAFLRHE